MIARPCPVCGHRPVREVEGLMVFYCEACKTVGIVSSTPGPPALQLQINQIASYASKLLGENIQLDNENQLLRERVAELSVDDQWVASVVLDARGPEDIDG